MTQSRLKCLLITPDQALADACRSAFRESGADLFSAAGPADCAKIIKNENPAAFILDASGMRAPEGAAAPDAVKKFRAATAPSVLVVLVAPEESSGRVLEILKLGANDVITKPVKPRLLAEQIKAFMRMSADRKQKTKKTLVSDNKALSLDIPGRRCYVWAEKPPDSPKTEVKLTRNEFLVLSILLDKRGTMIPYDDFRKRLWPDAVSFTEFHHTLLQHVTNIRKKIAHSSVKIENIWGEGYRID